MPTRAPSSIRFMRYDLLKLVTQAKNAVFEYPSWSERISSNFKAIQTCYI